MRIVKNKMGRSRGFAYVEFAESEQARKAVFQANDQPLKGRAMSVAISDPSVKTHRSERAAAADSADAPPTAAPSSKPAFKPRAFAGRRQDQPRTASRGRGGRMRLDIGRPSADSSQPASSSEEKKSAAQTSTATATAEAKPEALAAPKSNADFRAMFLGLGKK